MVGLGFSGGFTGLDIQKSRKQIEKFSESGIKAYKEIVQAAYDFSSGLSEKWASPKAVEFSETFREKMSGIQNDFMTILEHRIHGANDAGKTIAKAHGASWTDVEDNLHSLYVDIYGNAAYVVCKEELNGTTGMAVDNVKILRDTFKTAMDKGLTTLDSVPKAIEFYDSNGSLLNSYGTGIEKLQREIREAVFLAYKDISNYIDTETDNILLAQQAANDILNA